MSRDVRAAALAVTTDEPDIVLTLSPDVARTLRDLVGRVYGDHRYTYRQDTSVIYDALTKAGVRAVTRFERGNVTARDAE